ncbi:MAG: hopanoid biosynthesis associated radical SAM protein HpnJ, partial [Xanthomonadaceae bacterium]|nr:hopanoid biosynthesis associated radical SAM protein HpnJ [Xanthomonadaceae bacterium]
SFDDIKHEAHQRDLVVLHTSTPSFNQDVRTAELLKAENPALKIGMIGAKVAVDAEGSLKASEAIDFVARNEFDFTIKDIADGHSWAGIDGISYRNSEGVIVHNQDRAIVADMDLLPFVTPVYKRDLDIQKYYGGYLLHPYISFYTGRGCKSRCTFCLWPQTVGGHNYRVRSIGHVIEEVKYVMQAFPQSKEIFFDDDTLTDNLPRTEALAVELGKLGVVWSCNAKANVPYNTLKIMKDNGLRLLLVGFESGNQQILHNIKKGMRVEVAEKFTKDCHELGIAIHGTFILGLPGETRDSIEKTIEWAKAINPHTIQVSLAAPYPGTTLYRQAVDNGWLAENDTVNLVNSQGVQLAAISYPHLSKDEIFDAMEVFYRRFYFRPSKIWEIVREMLTDWDMLKRRLREGVEFFRFLRARTA